MGGLLKSVGVLFIEGMNDAKSENVTYFLSTPDVSWEDLPSDQPGGGVGAKLIEERADVIDCLEGL